MNNPVIWCVGKWYEKPSPDNLSTHFPGKILVFQHMSGDLQRWTLADDSTVFKIMDSVSGATFYLKP